MAVLVYMLSGTYIKFTASNTQYLSLCDKEYFEKNFRGGLENVETEECRKVNAEWCQWPNILEEGICFRAAKKILPAGSASMATSSANFLPSAYTLFNFYHQCGMGAAV